MTAVGWESQMPIRLGEAFIPPRLHPILTFISIHQMLSMMFTTMITFGLKKLDRKAMQHFLSKMFARLDYSSRNSSNRSYFCVCHQGYELTGHTTTFVDSNECNQSYNCVNGNCFNNEKGFICRCDIEPSEDNKSCVDIDDFEVGTDNCEAS